MGSITRTLFGGSKSKTASQSNSVAHNESGNTNNDFIKSAFGDTARSTQNSNDMLAKLLGLAGSQDQAESQAAFQNTPGYAFARDEGLRGVDQNFAGNGNFNSGARDKARMKFGTGLADQTYGQYMDRLFNYGQQGLQAGNLISGSGQYSFGDSTSNSMSKGKSTSQEPGVAQFLGAILASDPAVKVNVVKLDELHDGLGVYEYEYNQDNQHWGKGKQVGVMADEVAMLRPWALGPVIDGVQTVDYAKLEGVV